MCANIKFENLKCVVKERRSETKTILNSVSGSFHSGKLTGILGASGAGKTTLLNILAGYTTAGVTGDVYIDQIKKDSSDLKHISTYLPQDILLQPFLTVEESLKIAADLKLGNNDEFKKYMITFVIKQLGLVDFITTRSEFLSGGQRKRLSIALELISNPSVIFLDEPTTGLDNVAMKACVELLKSLALEGKTVICTIHQPSDSILKLFDYLYVMDKGCCIFDGAPNELVPFLASIKFVCPKTYNPMDYLLEITQMNNENRRLLTENTNQLRTNPEPPNRNKTSHSNGSSGVSKTGSQFSRQLSILLRRSFLQLLRNKTHIFVQCFHFTFCGLIVGATYFGMGQDAKHFFHMFCFCLVVLVYLVFCSAIPPALTYPLEYKTFKNEILNGWYGVNAYFVCLSLVSLVIPIIMSLFFTAITYFMSNQPDEADRFFKVYLIVILTITISESHGKAIAMCFNATYSALLGPASLVPLIALSFYGFGYGGQLSTYTKIAMQFSYIRYSMVGTFSALFDDRDKFECSALYCHYYEPRPFLIDMGMTGDYEIQVISLVGFCILYKCVVYVFLVIKMK